MDSTQADGFCLKGPRLMLRPWRTDDLAAFLRIVQNPQVMRLIGAGHTWDAETTAAFIDRQIRFQVHYGFSLWAMESTELGALIGFCGGRPFEPPAELPRERPKPPPTVEIGWRLAQEQWGKGLATEAATLAVRYLFDSIQVPKAVAIARAENRPSIRVMEKLGMNYEGSRLRDGAPIVQYGLAREEFQSR